MWKEKISNILVFSGFEIVEDLLQPAIRSYLDKYDEISRTDPFVLIEKLLETEGPIILNDLKIRKAMMESLDEAQLLLLKEELGIDSMDKYDTLDNLINQIIKFDWNWNSNQVKTFCAFFGVEDVIKDYFAFQLIGVPTILPDKVIPVENFKNFFELHSYQSRLRDDIIEKVLIDDEKRILLRVPTGGGKTRIAIHSIIKYLNYNKSYQKSVLWLSYSPLLVQQACETFCDIWNVLGQDEIKINKIFGSNSDAIDAIKNNEIIFGNVISLNSRLNNTESLANFANKIGLIVFDEVHQIRAPIAFKLISELQFYNEKIALIGLTATPGRGDLTGEDTLDLIKIFSCNIEIDVPPIKSIVGDLGKIAVETSKRTAISYLQEIGVLARLKEKRIDYKIDNLVLDNQSRDKIVIDNAIELLQDGKKVLIFARNTNHAKALSFLLRLNNFEVGLILGENRELRDKTINLFKYSGELNVLITYDVLTTGFDAPQLDAIIVDRPTDSVVTYSQILGRALRGPLNGGNPENLVVNVVDPKFGKANEIYKLFSEYWR